MKTNTALQGGKGFKRTKLACYTAYFTMSSIFSLPPLLFITFHQLYNISYTLLGTLVLINFFTQLGVDLLFTLFSKRLNLKKIVQIMPLITTLGLLIYAISPLLFKSNVYLGLVIGTVIFSISAGLSEVLLSPVIAAIPSKNPQKDMSLLHSLYAFGVVTVVIVSTLFFTIFGRENWGYLTVFFALLPIIASILFFTSPMPNLSNSESGDGVKGVGRRGFGLVFCIACIFFGSCAENVMSNWASSYIENALHINKTIGDILGMALFAILLGVGRIVYSRFGKKIGGVLLVGMLGAASCYLIAGFVPNSAVALIACALTGLFTSMLWPGSLILMEQKMPKIGVTAYALMAAGGDFGASFAPQLMGAIVDRVSASEFANSLSLTTGYTAEQIGMKTGMVVTSLFPILGAVVLCLALRYFKKTKSN